MVLASIGEQASTALFFASMSTLTFCHLRAASILKKRLASTKQIKYLASNEQIKPICEQRESETN